MKLFSQGGLIKTKKADISWFEFHFFNENREELITHLTAHRFFLLMLVLHSG